LFRVDQDMLVRHSSLHTPPQYPTRAGPPRHRVACQIQRFRHPDWRRALVIRPAVLVKFRGFGAQCGPKMRDRSRQLWPTARGVAEGEMHRSLAAGVAILLLIGLRADARA